MMRAALIATVLHTGCASPCATGRICEVAGTGDLGFNGDGLPGLETRLASPTAVLTDADGQVVVVDYSNMRVRVIGEDGAVRTLVGAGIHAFSEPGLDRLETPLENPVDAAWGPDGLLYVLAQHEGRVIRVGEDGRIELFAGTGVLADGASDVPALEAEMGYGGGMAWGPDGSLYVSDASFSRVRQVTPDGRVVTVLGPGGAGIGPVGHGPDTKLAFPERIAVDAAGERLLIADTGNHRVLAMDLESLQVEIVAGTGEPGYDGDGGPGIEARLSGPVGVAGAEDGTVLIADLNNNVLRAVSPSGVIRTVAGVAGDEPSRVAGPLDFVMLRPAGLAWTADGDVLIAERSGHRVLRWVGATDAL
jgi:sugar lactone lactonase YvrE